MRNNRKNRGSAMVESALILVIFISTLLAILDFGQFLFFHQVLTERVRHATRYAALNWDRGCQSDCVKNLVVYNSTTARHNGIAVPQLTPASVSVTGPNNSMDAKLTVTVRNYNFAVFNPWLTTSGRMRIRPITATAPVEAPNAN